MGNSSSQEDDRGSVGGMDANTDWNAQANEAASMMEGSGGLSSQLQLSISCKQLRNMDVDNGSLSDPFVVVKTKSSPTANWVEIGRTEIIANNLNPKWVDLIHVTYRFEEMQLMRFEVYDADSFSTPKATGIDITKMDKQGACEVPLPLIVGSAGQRWSGPLDSGFGSITIVAEEVPNQNIEVTLKLQGTGIVCPHHRFRSGVGNPFVRISRVPESSGTAIPCYRTEVVNGDPNPNWKTATVSLNVLAVGDKHHPLLLEVFGWRRSGAHRLWSSCKTSVADLEAGKTLTLELPPGAKKPAGSLKAQFTTRVIPSFLDYIRGGMELQFQVAIDYTASNGPPLDPTSLHFRSPNKLNDYASAISAIGQIISFYDHDKHFPVWGFGGKPVKGGPTEHCFAVNGKNDPEVCEVKGILEAYYKSLSVVELHGPTLFQPVITQAAALAASTQTDNPREMKYNILLILTDGLIGDMQPTCDAIVAAATLPFSIIIVGLGSADFSAMEVLDGDDVPLKNSTGQVTSRDIVQFVPFSQFAKASPQELAAEVLAEVPRQVVDYCKSRKILPAPPLTKQESTREFLQRRNSSMTGSQHSASHSGDVYPPPPPTNPSAPMHYVD